VGERGQVLTTVFAGTVGGHEQGGYGVANSTVARLLGTARTRAAAGATVGTGACTAG
jgi:hypothetical protein